ncbi:hypothetical protein BKA64DRAFT_640195 [Cadophora sp. MPI-SDFR-AT-0126]|nr:hypothetical protein BKA64DRAFT_640195 [Leotiomycetes sp. MPI-SDFR-AT-0126]
MSNQLAALDIAKMINYFDLLLTDTDVIGFFAWAITNQRIQILHHQRHHDCTVLNNMYIQITVTLQLDSAQKRIFFGWGFRNLDSHLDTPVFVAWTFYSPVFKVTKLQVVQAEVDDSPGRQNLYIRILCVAVPSVGNFAHWWSVSWEAFSLAVVSSPRVWDGSCNVQIVSTLPEQSNSLPHLDPSILPLNHNKHSSSLLAANIQASNQAINNAPLPPAPSDNHNKLNRYLGNGMALSQIRTYVVQTYMLRFRHGAEEGKV